MSTTPETPVRILIAGGSYAGLATAISLLWYSHGSPDLTAGEKNASDNAQTTPPATPRRKVPLEITMVDERDGYVHLIGCPLAFFSTSYAAKMWVPYSQIPFMQRSDVVVKRGSLVHVDVNEMVARVQLATPGEGELNVEYDYFVAATGLRRAYPVVPQSRTKEAFMKEIRAHVDLVQDAGEGIVVIGGGAVGIEMAGEAKVVFPEKKVTLVHSRQRLLSSEPLPDNVAEAALTCLREEGVEVLLGRRVVSNEEVELENGEKVRKLRLQDGTELTAGHVINAISKSKPTTSYLPASALDKDRLVKVDTSFRFLPGHEGDAHHLAIGDIIAWSGIKRCGGALAEGARAADNIYQQILYEQDGLQPKIEPWPVDVPGMIGLAVGKQAVGYHPSTGLKKGEDQLEYLFGNDLGFDYCWKHMMAKAI